MSNNKSCFSSPSWSARNPPGQSFFSQFLVVARVTRGKCRRWPIARVKSQKNVENPWSPGGFWNFWGWETLFFGLTRPSYFVGYPDILAFNFASLHRGAGRLQHLNCSKTWEHLPHHHRRANICCPRRCTGEQWRGRILPYSTTPSTCRCIECSSMAHIVTDDFVVYYAAFKHKADER